MKVPVGTLVLLGVWVAAAVGTDGGEKRPPASAPAIEAPPGEVRQGDPRLRRPEGGRRGGGRAGQMQRDRRWGPPDRRPGEPPRHDDFAPSPQEVEEFMSFAREHFPELHERLSRMRAADPAAFRAALRRLGPSLGRLARTWREDPELARRMIAVQKAEMSIFRLLEDYRRAADEEQRAALREKLRRLLEERFELRLERLREEIASLRRRLEEQSRRLAEQEVRKRELLEEEFNDLLRRLERPDSADLEHHQ